MNTDLFKMRSKKKYIAILIGFLLLVVVGLYMCIYSVITLLNNEYTSGSFWTKEGLILVLAFSFMLMAISVLFGVLIIVSSRKDKSLPN